ncbi:hypothetical protein ACIQRW_37940 [Streptomyces sp. NPDC091287]|uniref:hypothetical protein n=1 Tax=Streptomyces sp. NPDC091287 TaxID=3365988 RepID=UPI0037F4456C
MALPTTARGQITSVLALDPQQPRPTRTTSRTRTTRTRATRTTARHRASHPEETRAGRELRDDLQVFQDRYEIAVRTGDIAALTQVCTGKHGRWGRTCVQSAGHETRTPHWGITPDGEPVAWIGSAPDDD